MFHIWVKLQKIKTCQGDKKCCTIEEQLQLRHHLLLSEAKPNHKVVFGLKNCESLLGNKRN